MEAQAYEELFSLERQLRTGTAEQQLAAIHQLPDFMARHRISHVVISGAYLKAADHFCSSNNERRITIVQALEACREYSQDARTHADEVVRRLGTIWDSNDVLARSLVVQFYGAMAGCLHSCGEALYRVQQSLRSEHDEEVEVALEAARRLAAWQRLSPMQPFVEPSIALVRHAATHSRRRLLAVKLLQMVCDGASCVPTYECLCDILQDPLVPPRLAKAILDTMNTLTIRCDRLFERHVFLLEQLNDLPRLSLLSKNYVLNPTTLKPLALTHGET